MTTMQRIAEIEAEVYDCCRCVYIPCSIHCRQPGPRHMAPSEPVATHNSAVLSAVWWSHVSFLPLPQMARTQKNKATSRHIGLLKAKLAKLRTELVSPAKVRCWLVA